MRAHVCDQECPCGHWHRMPRQATTNAGGVRGRMTLDVYDGTVDFDANAYREYDAAYMEDAE